MNTLFKRRRRFSVCIERSFRKLRWLLVAAAACALMPPAAAQSDGDDEIIVPDAVSDVDVEMRARYCRQWKQEEGRLVLLFNGGFRMDFGPRRMTADNAVLWLTPRRAPDTGSKYYEMTVYLSDNAEVRESAGTTTQDAVLLVSNLRTRGRISKFHDAHAPEAVEDSSLYQRAVVDRALIEQAYAQAADATPAEAAPPQVTRRSDAAARKAARPPRRIAYNLPGGLNSTTTPEGEQVYVSIGRLYLSQAGAPDSPVLEIQADSAVVFPKEGAAGTFIAAAGAEDGQPPPGPASAPGVGAGAAQSPPASQPDQPSARDVGDRLPIRAVYLEGDVILSAGNRFIRADRLYYDFELDRALILDAVLRADVPDRAIPLYIRAAEVRQLSAREYAAEGAKLTTSEFYTPHYHVGAERVYLRDRTARDADGDAAGPIAGTYEVRNGSFNVGGVPFLFWPYSRGNFETSETLLRRFRAFASDEFGASVETAWYLFNLLGLETPPGFDATLELNYYGKRGPAAAVNVDYEREKYFGLFRSFYVHDNGEDNLGPLRENEPTTENRGRLTWRHRQFLPNDWDLTLELSYVSDPNFLETYEKSEWFEGKEQETLVYLKRVRGVEAISLLANWRLLDFTTQTEHMPDLTYRRIGDVILDQVLSYHESRIGNVRYRPDDRQFFDTRRFDNRGLTDATLRGDTRQEFEWPLKIGAGSLVPFGSVRGSYWDGQPLDDGGLWRGLGVAGVRGAISFSRIFDAVQSQLLDINRIRHIVKPDFAAWYSGASAKSEEITPFDYGIETIDGFYGATLGLRQTWQTKRGPEGAQRTVDLLTLNLEAGFFGDADERLDRSNGFANPLRPENSRTRNYLAGEAIYRLSDTTSILYDFNVDANDRNFDRHNLSIAVERLPRLAYVFGVRHAGDIDLTLVGGGWNYKLNEKHITAVRAWYDVERGDLGEYTLSYIRKLPRWYFSINFEYSNVDDDYNLSIAMWPEGIPEWALGSRRFSGVTTSTGIRP